MGRPVCAVIRLCVGAPPGAHYLEVERDVRRGFDAVINRLTEHAVKIGVQNHYGAYIPNAMGIRHLIEDYDPAVVGAVWDGAHCGLNGEQPELAAAILWSHLCLVNFKNARWKLITRKTPISTARFEAEFVPAPEGLCPWEDVLRELRLRDYTGDFCMSAEYSDAPSTDDVLAADRRYLADLLRAVT